MSLFKLGSRNCNFLSTFEKVYCSLTIFSGLAYMDGEIAKKRSLLFLRKDENKNNLLQTNNFDLRLIDDDLLEQIKKS